MHQHIKNLLNPLCHRKCYWFERKGTKRSLLQAIRCWMDYEVIPWIKPTTYNGAISTYINGKPTLFYYRHQLLK